MLTALSSYQNIDDANFANIGFAQEFKLTSLASVTKGLTFTSTLILYLRNMPRLLWQPVCMFVAKGEQDGGTLNPSC